MTTLAMTIGMVPMDLSLGEGGEQNAPLGRAVIGGLIFATAATLFFVPTVFMLVSRRRRFETGHVSPDQSGRLWSGGLVILVPRSSRRNELNAKQACYRLILRKT